MTDLVSLAHNWNGIYDSMMTLVFAVTGGNDWEPLACPFYHMGNYGAFHGMVFTFFIFPSTVGLLNILVGVFCQKTTDIGSVYRDAALAQALSKSEHNRNDFNDLFDEFNTDKNDELDK